jgi:hypothetical protein
VKLRTGNSHVEVVRHAKRRRLMVYFNNTRILEISLNGIREKSVVLADISFLQ